MVIRFKYAGAIEGKIRKAVDKATHMFDGQSEPLIVDGIEITHEYLAENFHLLDNLDLYMADDIADGIHGEICGQMLMVLRSAYLLEENAKVIVPDKSNPNYNVSSIGWYSFPDEDDEDDEPYNPEDWYIGDLLMSYLDELDETPEQHEGIIVNIDDFRNRDQS